MRLIQRPLEMRNSLFTPLFLTASYLFIYFPAFKLAGVEVFKLFPRRAALAFAARSLLIKLSTSKSQLNGGAGGVE